MTPRVTVLLAVRNGEPFVRECVASVLEQTFADFELLVVDDASSDRTVEIVESFADPRVRVLRNKRNVGQAPSLNRGLREAVGDYVARIDADDRCRPTRLERQVAILDREPSVGLVGTWLEIVGEDGRRLHWLRETLADYVDFVFHTLIMRVQIPHPAALYRRRPVLDLGAYDESTAPAEDKDLWRKLALGRWDARIVPEPLVVYRYHDAQLSQTQAAYQQSVDRRSQDRFLAELAPGESLAGARELLGAENELWSGDAAAALVSVERVLAGAAERLRLDEGGARRLETLVARHLLAVARLRPWSAVAGELRAWALPRVPRSERRLEHARALAARPAAPALRATRSAGRALVDVALHVPALRALRTRLKRSRVARVAYAKLVSPRPLRGRDG